jgi:hypothetical protein
LPSGNLPSVAAIGATATSASFPAMGEGYAGTGEAPRLRGQAPGRREGASYAAPVPIHENKRRRGFRAAAEGFTGIVRNLTGFLTSRRRGGCHGYGVPGLRARRQACGAVSSS